MKKNTQPQHEQTARKHILRTEEFIRFLIAMTIGGMLVFGLFRIKIDNMNEQCSTTVYEYITCMPENFTQNNGTIRWTMNCRTTTEYDTLSASREKTPMQRPAETGVNEHERYKPLMDIE